MHGNLATTSRWLVASCFIAKRLDRRPPNLVMTPTQGADSNDTMGTGILLRMKCIQMVQVRPQAHLCPKMLPDTVYRAMIAHSIMRAQLLVHCAGTRSLPKQGIDRGDHVTTTRRAVSSYGRALHASTEGLLG